MTPPFFMPERFGGSGGTTENALAAWSRADPREGSHRDPWGFGGAAPDSRGAGVQPPT